jgi:glycosyltransferase involved in cell wall biosynthesis
MSEIIKVIIPAFNEQDSIKLVLRDIPKSLVDEVIVVNNNSSDLTGQVAENEGVTVLCEQRKGYGFACLKGLDYIKEQKVKPDAVVFLDADYSDYPNEMPALLDALFKQKNDLVIGARVQKWRESGSMTPPQVFGNWLATSLLKLLYGASFTDLGPFRAIRYDALEKMNMQDQTFGWTVEMQIKALKLNMPYTEVPVHYRNRIGVSKISGTVKGTILAGYKILLLIFKYSLK